MARFQRSSDRRVFGTPHDGSASNPGGILVLIRDYIRVEASSVHKPFDGFIWIDLPCSIGTADKLHIGGAYIPGPTDIRFRSLQGAGKQDHFESLRAQLERRADDSWILGGDLNSITGESQPLSGPSDMLDHEAPDT